MNKPSTDWRTLPAGRELDRVIGQRLGVLVGPKLPDYSTDANAALTLPLAVGLEWRLELASGPWYFVEIGSVVGNEVLAKADGKDGFAWAICRAWLAWKGDATK